MGRRGKSCFCGSCKCGETTVTADGTVTWISHTVADGVITRVENESSCKTYWVDSVSGGGAESGTGTEEDPWTNLNTVFSDTCIYTICNGGSEGSVGCPMIKVLVKGTIDYIIDGGSQDYLRRLVFEPWENAEITIDVDVSASGYGTAIANCVGCIFKNLDALATAVPDDGGQNACAFYYCSSSIFNTCIGSATIAATTVEGGYYGVQGFESCADSVFDLCSGICTGTHNESNAGMFGWGFGHNSNSTFYTCEGSSNISSNIGMIDAVDGFWECTSSVFNSCTGSGAGTATNGYAYYNGFHQCGLSVFSDCTGSGTGTGLPGSTGYGFQGCDSSSFDTCGGSSVTCGFYNCSPIGGSSTFTDCTATPTGSPCDT